jgi:hypothetical protein
MMTIDLAGVYGAAQNPDPGRCGPGDSLPFLGDIHTVECGIHDSTVKSYEDKGDPNWLAQIKSLPQLPSAVGSYFSALIFGQGPK